MSFQFVKEHRDYLKQELEARIKRRPLYSQRAFARDIEISPSALNEYLKGKIRLSPGRVIQVSKYIGLNHEQRQHWVDLINMKYAKSSELRKISEVRVNSRLESQNHSISIEQFKVISEWYHLAYLQLIMMNAEKYSNLKAAASALNVPIRQLREGVNRLEQIALLKKNELGHYNVNSSIKIGDNSPSLAIQQYHKQMIEKALLAIEHQPIHKRFASSTMVALPKSEIENIMYDIQSLAINYLTPYINKNKNYEKDSIYCLTLQFFNLLSDSKI